MKVRAALMHPLFCSVGLSPSRSLYLHKHNILSLPLSLSLSLSPSPVSYPSNLFLFTLHLSGLPIFTLSALPPSVVAPAHLSHFLSFLETVVLGQRVLEMLS